MYVKMVVFIEIKFKLKLVIGRDFFFCFTFIHVVGWFELKLLLEKIMTFVIALYDLQNKKKLSVTNYPFSYNKF